MSDIVKLEDHIVPDEEEHVIQTIECRYCHEEDILENMEVPCACRGTLKFAHRKCVQQWCNAKRYITCEICLQPFHPGYTAISTSKDTMIDSRQQLTEAGFDDYIDTKYNKFLVFLSVALNFIAILLSIQAKGINNPDVLVFSLLLLLQHAVFYIPFYILRWRLRVARRRRDIQVISYAHGSADSQSVQINAVINSVGSHPSRSSRTINSTGRTT